MSSEKTGNLGLHKWAPTDGVLRTEFNDNFGKIDEKVAVIGDVALIPQNTIVDALKDKDDKITTVNTQLAETGTRIKDLWVDVKKEFGAKGDGVIDDSDSIQAAFDAINHEAGTKIKLYFPKGTYRITRPIIGHRINIFSEGSVIISCDGAEACFDFNPIDPVVVNEFYELFIDKLGFRGKNGAKRGIRIRRGSQFYLEKIYLYDFIETGIEIDDCTIGYLIRPSIATCNTGVLFKNASHVNIEHGNFYANQSDIKFVGFNSGIGVINSWFEESVCSFLWDNTTGMSNCEGLYVTHSLFCRNGAPGINGGPVFKVIGTNAANVVIAQNIIFKMNKLLFNLTGLQNAIDINLTGGHANSNLHFSIADNHFYNSVYPDAYFVKTIGNTAAQLQLIYEDNLTTSSNVNIVEGVAWVTGIDRSGSKIRFFNKVRGELILDPSNAQLSSLEGAFSWNSTVKLPRFHDGTTYREIPYRGEFLANSSATDITQLKTDFNNLLTILKNAKIMKNS